MNGGLAPRIVFKQHPRDRDTIQAVHFVQSEADVSEWRSKIPLRDLALAYDHAPATATARRAQGTFNASATIDDVVFPGLLGSTLERVHTAAKLCITSFPDEDYNLDAKLVNSMLADGDGLFGPSVDTADKESQARLDMSFAFRSELKTSTFGDAANPAPNATAFLGDPNGFDKDEEVGVYAILWTSNDGQRVLAYRGSYNTTDFYNIRLLFGNYMYSKSRERLVDDYRSVGIAISDDEENQEGVGGWFYRQASRFGEACSNKQPYPSPRGSNRYPQS